MVNYKANLRTISGGGFTVSVPSGAVLKYLYEKTASATTADTMLDSLDGLVYQVPTGKVFHLVVMIIHGDETLTVGSVQTFTGDTEDAETAAKLSMPIPLVVNKTIECLYETTWAAGKFVVIKPTAASVEFIEMRGYETDT